MVQVFAAGSVLLMHPGQLVQWKAIGNAHQRGPQALVQQGDLGVDQPALQHFGRGTYLLQLGKDVVAARMCPPAAFDRLASEHVDQSRHRAMRCQQDHTVLSYKVQRRSVRLIASEVICGHVGHSIEVAPGGRPDRFCTTMASWRICGE